MALHGHTTVDYGVPLAAVAVERRELRERSASETGRLKRLSRRGAVRAMAFRAVTVWFRAIIFTFLHPPAPSCTFLHLPFVRPLRLHPPPRVLLI